MKVEATTKRFEFLLSILLLSLVSALVYLPFVPKFGYFNDDWYLMFSAGAKGSSVFWDIFAIDRPLRALVMIPAYTLFGADPLYYNLSAFLFRLIGGLSFLWILRMLWPQNRRTTLWMSLLFLLYPGFLSQPNAIDYLCHMAGLAGGMLSIGLTLLAVQSNVWMRKALLYLASILLGWFCLSQIEWYIGLEFFRFACLFLLALRLNETLWKKTVKFIQYSLPAALIPGVFLVWRLFYFESERGATDVDLQLTDLRAEPLTFILKYSSALFNDFTDVLFRAWWVPFRRSSGGFGSQQWLAGFGIALSILLLLWIFSRFGQKPGETESGIGSMWRREALWVGLGAIIVGLLPVILVGRSVDFKNYSRYTLIASVGAAMLWPLLLSFISSLRLRNILFGILIVSASLTHYANGFVKASETEATRNFWWQVSWRIPQIGPGATFITRYLVAVEEDYFTWGPANLIYHPESDHEKYVQPALYALVLNEETVEKVLAREPQDYSNRRSIRTYPNYRNILILSQPRHFSCVQVIDLHQIELSSFEDSRISAIAPFSEADQISLNVPFQVPPEIPFGSEPPKEWCYFYEKASYARQLGDWDEVLRLGEEAISRGYFARDQIEWMPFLQAYASSGDIARLNEIASHMTSDLPALQQACHTLTAMPLDPAVEKEVNQLFCIE
ncbi:MAG: hypothetical protein IH589_07465 [Anaerolineales bacterium]|nr:hypothetical protein [Anaerolineales bacterium]